ncbi:hypothetical protein FQA39_LY03463 [Lamprigera yunnana]|nr:hypothetical protein FQA39_LY03463 [Lamprigera yunnana]
MNDVEKKKMKISIKEGADRITTPSTKTICSPLYSQLQDDCDNIDVVWDWQSPKSKQKVYKKRTKIVQSSPKTSIKRHPSNDQILGYSKLGEELKTLTDKITIESKETKANDRCSSKTKDLEEFFNDSMEEILLKCSQQVEYIIDTSTPKKLSFEEQSDNLKSMKHRIENDSLDSILEAFNEEDFKVENKRNEMPKEESPIKCSPEEIEQKRLQALAKLEDKKIQKIIEQKQREALKRLEFSRKRKVLQN